MDIFWIWFISIVLMAIGLVGTVVPALPGMGLVFLGILMYAASTGFEAISPVTVGMFGVIAFLGWLASFLGSVWGARMGGGKGAALGGTIVGAIAGVILLGPPGLVIGAFLGGLLGALISGKQQEQAVKIALYSVFGILGGAIMQFVLALALIGSFLLAVFI